MHHCTVQRRDALVVKHPWVAATVKQVPQDSVVSSGRGEVDWRSTYKGRMSVILAGKYRSKAQDSHAPSAVVELTSIPNSSTRNLQTSRCPFPAAKWSAFRPLVSLASRRFTLIAITNQEKLHKQQ